MGFESGKKYVDREGNVYTFAVDTSKLGAKSIMPLIFVDSKGRRTYRFPGGTAPTSIGSPGDIIAPYVETREVKIRTIINKSPLHGELIGCSWTEQENGFYFTKSENTIFEEIRTVKVPV